MSPPASASGTTPEPRGRLLETCGLFATAWLALALPCFLYDLNLPDEPRVAHTSFEMLRTGDFVLPTVNGESFLHTPPGFYWLLALWFSLVGTEPDGIARLVPVACAAGTLVVVFSLTRRHAGRRAALISVAVLASTFHFWDIGHRVTVDMALTLFTNLALLALSGILLESRIRPWWGPLFGLFAAAAFLVKGVVGPGILALVLAGVLARHRALWTRARVATLAVSAAVAAAALLPWLAALYGRDPSYPSELAIEHVWDRAVGGVAHDPSNWQFFHRMLLHLMPWTVVLPFVLYGQGRRAWRRSGREGEDTARFIEFLLFAFLLPLIALLISRGKRNLYLLPAVPAIAMLAGVWVESRLDTRAGRRVVEGLVWISGLGGAAGLIAALLVAPAAGSGLVFAALIVHFYRAVRWFRRRRRGTRAVEGAVADGSVPARSAGDRSSPVCTALALLLLCVAGWGSFYHVMRNPRYTAAPLGLRAEALESRSHEIVSYRLFQREYAAVAWYLRHPIPHFEDPARLMALLEAAPADGPNRLALLVEAEEREALGGTLAGWEEIYRTKLRRREILVMVKP